MIIITNKPIFHILNSIVLPVPERTNILSTVAVPIKRQYLKHNVICSHLAIVYPTLNQLGYYNHT